MAGSGVFIQAEPYTDPSWLSGAVSFGQIASGAWVSGTIASGYASFEPSGAGLPWLDELQGGGYAGGYSGLGLPSQFRCWRCDKPVKYSDSFLMTVAEVSGLWERHCFDCVGYNPNSGGFDWQKEHYIRMGCPLGPDAPWYALADWLDDNGKHEAAEIVRNLHREG